MHKIRNYVLNSLLFCTLLHTNLYSMEYVYCPASCNPYENTTQSWMSTMGYAIAVTGVGICAAHVKEMVKNIPDIVHNTDKMHNAIIYGGVMGLACAITVPGFVPDPCYTQSAVTAVSTMLAAGIGFHYKIL